jgi:hypothetical protein
MKLQNFDDFSKSSVNESRYYFGGGGGSIYSGSSPDMFSGKTKFSRWMRSIASDYKSKQKELVTPDSSPEGDLGTQTLRRSQSVIPLFGRLIFGAGAAITDFFTGKKGKDGNKLTKKEVEQDMDKVLDKWEDSEIKNKKVTQKDAEEFYTSGVLQGQKYFGGGYDPSSPRNKDEKAYTEYLGGAMNRYFDKID